MTEPLTVPASEETPPRAGVALVSVLLLITPFLFVGLGAALPAFDGLFKGMGVGGPAASLWLAAHPQAAIGLMALFGLAQLALAVRLFVTRTDTARRDAVIAGLAGVALWFALMLCLYLPIFTVAKPA